MGWGRMGWDRTAQGCLALNQTLLGPSSRWGDFIFRTGPGIDKCSFTHQPFAGFPNKCVVSCWLSCFRRATCECPKGTETFLEILHCFQS